MQGGSPSLAVEVDTNGKKVYMMALSTKITAIYLKNPRKSWMWIYCVIFQY